MNYVVARQLAYVLAGTLLLLQPWATLNAKEPPGFLVKSNAVGRVALDRYVTPTGQWLTPAGQQVELPGLRPQAIAISPDGKLLVTAGRTNFMAVIDLTTGRLRQKAPLSSRKVEVKLEPVAPESDDPAAEGDDTGADAEMPVEKPANGTNKPPSTTAQMSFTGLAFAPDGKHIYLANAAGTVRAFPVGESNVIGIPLSFNVPDAKLQKSKKEIPTGMAVSADSKRVYVLGNLANKLHEMDATNGRVIRSWDTGVAPYDVVLVGEKAYVSNLGGRRPSAGTLTAPAGKGTSVRVDSVRHIPNEGSVTVVDLAAGTVKTEIMVELHPLRPRRFARQEIRRRRQHRQRHPQRD